MDKVPHVNSCCKFYIQLEEPLLLLGREKFEGVDIRVRVRGGGQVSQVYGKIYTYMLCMWCYYLYPAIRQAISKSLVAYYQKCKLFFLENAS